MDDLVGDTAQIPGPDAGASVGGHHHQVDVVLVNVLEYLFGRVPHHHMAARIDAPLQILSSVLGADLLGLNTQPFGHALHVCPTHRQQLGLVRIADVQQLNIYVHPAGQLLRIFEDTLGQLRAIEQNHHLLVHTSAPSRVPTTVHSPDVSEIEPKPGATLVYRQMADSTPGHSKLPPSRHFSQAPRMSATV